MMKRIFFIVLVVSCFGLVYSESVLENNKSVVTINAQAKEIYLTAVIQKTEKPRIQDWGSAEPALLGSKHGKYKDYFLFLVDADVTAINTALRKLGASSTVVYKMKDIPKHKGYSKNTSIDDYLQGNPVQIYIVWNGKDGEKRVAYEDFFQEKIIHNDMKVIKPWTPHFAYHGSGVLNNMKTGCIACTHDCPGGIIGNNQFPIGKPIPVLKAVWDKLPEPGTKITVVIRI